MIFIVGAIGWWSMSLNYEIVDNSPMTNRNSTVEAKMDFTFEEVSYESETTTKGETDSYKDDADLIGDLEDVGGTTGLIFTLGMVMTIIVVILLSILIGIVYTRNPGLSMYSKMFKNLVLIFALLAVIFILIAPLYYLIVWPKTFEDQMGSASLNTEEKIYDGSFMGSNNFEFEEEWFIGTRTYRGESRWGPGPGWILAFICLFLSIITLVLVKSAGDEAMRLAPATQPRPQPQYPPPPPKRNQQPHQIYLPRPPQYPQQPP